MLCLIVVPVVTAQTPVPSDPLDGFPETRPAGGQACTAATPCAGDAGQLAQVPGRTVLPVSAGSAVRAQSSNGFALATVVMVALLLAFFYALAVLVWAGLGHNAPGGPRWAWSAIPVLAVVGLGVAFYLTFVETQNVKAVCGPVGDCNTVQSSSYARLFGVIPVGLMGIAGYVGILIAWFVGRTGEGRLGGVARLVLVGMALFGVLFSIYLTYIELYVIHAVCIWCLSSAVIMALLLAISVGPALQALLAPDEGYLDSEEEPAGSA